MQQEWVIPAKIKQIKGNLSFRELEEAIYRTTGIRVSHSSLQRLAQGKQHGSHKILKALSKYANKPISWFFEPDEYCEEDSTLILTLTGDPLRDQVRTLLFNIIKNDDAISKQNLKILADIARHIIEDIENKKETKKNKGIIF